MSYGLKAFRKIQYGIESTHGTAVAADEIVFGTLSVKPSDHVWHKPEQDRGVLATNVETPFEVSKEIELDFEGEAADRLLVFLFNLAIRGNITPTQPDDSGEPNHYLWLFEMALTTPNTPDETNGIETATIEYGDNVQAYEVEYAFLTNLEISGTVNEAIMVSATFMGRQVGEVSFTGSLTAPAYAYYAFNNSTFYIDTSYAGIGGTQKTGMLRAFTWTFETMFMPLFAADGNLYFSQIKEDKKTVQLELTYWRDDTNTEAEFDKYAAQTTSYIRIALASDTEMDSGQDNPSYVYLDGAFKYTEFPELDDEDGTSVVTVTAEAFYDATSSKMFSVSVGTIMDALPS